MSDKELFEEEVKEEAPVEIEVVERKPEPEVKEVVEKPVKTAPVKKKRVVTEAQKAKLIENLKRGRETSLANRKKKAKLTELAKQEKMVEDDHKIFEALKRKLKPKELEDENAMLKKELAELKSAKKAPAAERPKTPAPEPEPEPEVVKPIAKPVVNPPMTTRQKMKKMRGL
tara:strand:- start:452 stop:967 length:516 start_codon:yes stop_codon:yes gene_type:complete